jgi:hypothetical protein
MAFHDATCPYCGNPHCSTEWCDIGVGFQQISPFHCDRCHAVEIGPYDNTEPTAAEKAAGWYAPGRLPDTVSSVNGCLIDTKTALRLYEAGAAPKAPFHLTLSDEALIKLLGFSVVSTAKLA